MSHLALVSPSVKLYVQRTTDQRAGLRPEINQIKLTELTFEHTPSRVAMQGVSSDQAVRARVPH
ncbi:hypothetical protein [Glutamicibacter sp. Je.9.36]|uniref:hypothetical protein n=1 Tax=Glutamicibacter sp. Je.9.36 TaxID=3142837 RepID=UPI003DA930D5